MPTKHLATRIRAKISTEPCGLITPVRKLFRKSVRICVPRQQQCNRPHWKRPGRRELESHGIAAHLRYKMFDLHGMYTLDRIAHVPMRPWPTLTKSASGLSVALDTYVTTHTLLSLRYDNMDAGGDLSQRTSQSFLECRSNSTCGPTWPCSLETISTCDGQKTATRQPVIYDTPFRGDRHRVLGDRGTEHDACERLEIPSPTGCHRALRIHRTSRQTRHQPGLSAGRTTSLRTNMRLVSWHQGAKEMGQPVGSSAAIPVHAPATS